MCNFGLIDNFWLNIVLFQNIYLENMKLMKLEKQHMPLSSKMYTHIPTYIPTGRDIVI